MPNVLQLRDKHGVRQIWPASDSTRYRAMKRPTDPFPPGRLILGKRYWPLSEVLAWIERQDTGHDPDPETRAA